MNWNVEAYRATVFRRLQLSLDGTERVLDLGCGEGGDAEWLAARARTTLGVDLVEHPRWPSVTRPDLRFERADAQALGLDSAAFDLVFLKDVLHHANDPDQVLAEAKRVCAPGGRIYVVEGNRFNPVFYLHMTLMLGHQHFRRPVFEALIRRTFPQARLIRFEAHVYPFSIPALLAVARGIEAAIAVTPAIRRLASYNAAIIRR